MDYKEQIREVRDASKVSRLDMVLWVLVSIGLWNLAPDAFKYTEGPAGVFTMIIAAGLGMVISTHVSFVVRRYFRRR